jgi:hypothetical protein
MEVAPFLNKTVAKASPGQFPQPFLISNRNKDKCKGKFKVYNFYDFLAKLFKNR